MREPSIAKHWTALLAAALAACGGSSDTTHASTDAGAADQSAQDTGSAANDGSPDAKATTDATAANDASGAADGDTEGSAADGAGSACLAAFNGGAVCNVLEPQGPEIVATCSDASAPQPIGGAIADGTYVLESMTLYPPCGPAQEIGRYTWLACGSTWTTVQETPRVPSDPDAGALVSRITVTVAGSGSMLTVTPICSAPNLGNAPTTWSYDATGTRLTLYVKGSAGGVRADTFVRQ